MISYSLQKIEYKNAHFKVVDIKLINFVRFAQFVKI